MQLLDVHKKRSPLDPDWVRLAADVAYSHGNPSRETYWFDVPEYVAEDLSDNANPWLACLIPLAVALDEPLELCRPVDPVMLKNVHGLMGVWKNWYPELSIVPVLAETEPPPRNAGKTAAFFSGGIDSFFTALRHLTPDNSVNGPNIDELIFVWGFDIPIDRRDGFERARRAMQEAADALGKPLIVAATNLKITRLQRNASYAELWHGGGLASVGLALERRYATLYIASTYGYLNMQPWGSHPLTDPLYSTSRCEVIHDDACFNRVEKTALVAQSDIALRTLRVCWNSKSDANCSTCNKCMRTMATLELFGALDRCTTFRPHAFHPERLARVYSSDENDRLMLREVASLATERGRIDISEAIALGLERSEHLHKWFRLAQWLATKPYLWRWAERMHEYFAYHYVL